MHTQPALINVDQEANDNFIQSPVNSHVVGEGGFSDDFRIDPPGLRGLNRLTVQLNELLRAGTISNWHLGRWKNRSQTVHSVLFSSARELDAARLATAI